MVLDKSGRVLGVRLRHVTDFQHDARQAHGAPHAALDNLIFFFSSRRRHTRYWRDWSSDVCSSDLSLAEVVAPGPVKEDDGTDVFGIGRGEVQRIRGTQREANHGKAVVGLSNTFEIGRASCRERV